MTATISVTREHIANGVREDCEHCPIALAILETFPDVNYAAVGPDACTIGTPDGSDTELNLPGEALDFIWGFDDDGAGEPFTFELDYPAVTS